MKTVLDIFSYLPRKQFPVKTIEQMFLGISDPAEAGIEFCSGDVILDGCVQEAADELRRENKKVAIAKRGGEIVAVIGYREQ